MEAMEGTYIRGSTRPLMSFRFKSRGDMGEQVPSVSSLELRWKVLSDLLVELRAHGAEVPPDVVKDLRSAKSLIEVLKVSPECEGVAGRIDALLANVEAFLLAEAEVRLGPEEAKRWGKKLSEAVSRAEVARLEERIRFRPGLPRGEYWVRVRTSDEIPRELVEELAGEEGVSVSPQPDGFLLVSGDRDKVRSFIRRLSEHFKRGR